MIRRVISGSHSPAAHRTILVFVLLSSPVHSIQWLKPAICACGIVGNALNLLILYSLHRAEAASQARGSLVSSNASGATAAARARASAALSLLRSMGWTGEFTALRFTSLFIWFDFRDNIRKFSSSRAFLSISICSIAAPTSHASDIISHR